MLIAVDQSCRVLAAGKVLLQVTAFLVVATTLTAKPSLFKRSLKHEASKY